PTPQPQLSAIHSVAATPSNLNVPSPAPIVPSAEQHVPPQITTAAAGQAPGPQDAGSIAPDQGTGSGDWIVVPKGGVSPDAGAAHQALVGPSSEAAKLPTPIANPASPAGTPAGSTAFDGDQNDFSSLGDLDTAGDALASFDSTLGG